jgi:DNA-binding PadR family transcriptional regulator
MPGRVLGLYALSTMEREGHLYGYELAERISQRTDGAWRPGPGAIYPALAALAGRGLARSRFAGRRRMYSLTPKGRGFLRRVRRQMLWRTRGGPDLGALWSEIAGANDPGQFRLERLQHQVDAMVGYLARDGLRPSETSSMQAQVREILRRAESQLDRLPSRARPTARRPRRRSP